MLQEQEWVVWHLFHPRILVMMMMLFPSFGANLFLWLFKRNLFPFRIQQEASRTATWNSVVILLTMMSLPNTPIFLNVLLQLYLITSPMSIGFEKVRQRQRGRQHTYFDSKLTTSGSTGTALFTITSQDQQMICLTYVHELGISLILNCLLILIHIFHRKNNGGYACFEIR